MSEQKIDASDREILTTRVFESPRELVFDAWTNPVHVARWWGPNGFTTTTHVMDVRPGGAWRFVMHGPDGTDYQNEIIFEEIERPSRLTYTHTAPWFHTTVTFDDLDGKTSLTMRMRFETAEERDRVVEKFGALEGAKQHLESLEAFLAKPTEVPSGASSEPEFVISRDFDAPRALVFQAWTEPTRLARWWGPAPFTTPVCELDARPGGAYRLVMRSTEGVDYPLKGAFLEVVAPDRIVMTMDASEHPKEWHDLLYPNRSKDDKNPARVMVTTVTFEDVESKTRLTIRTRFETQAIRDAMVNGGMNEGWSSSLERLRTLLDEG